MRTEESNMHMGEKLDKVLNILDGFRYDRIMNKELLITHHS